ncbi:VPLPA-CTERM sorting domain-containing protein [Pacificoceanicola onchidii]|uniref:VPLPA-CTERM sorting domain-containing protein n=1 Tax=Pacificoceanicola onchidii TaxID=2562685 RepID=UPI0010A5E127|nr:VPLPA-CTERM sorting domain-containing protein [Pacificoceanicola onchidii]
MSFLAKLAAAFVCVSGAAQASTLLEDFSGGLNGWSHLTTPGAAQPGGTPGGATVALIPNGGPGGTGDAYIEYSEADTNWHHAIFGDGWIGDLSAFNGGTFSLNYVQTFGLENAHSSTFGTLRVSGGGESALVDMVPGLPSGSWQTATIGFNASTFGVSEGTWAGILGNVSEIRFQTEAVSGGEIIGLDNITLTSPAPVPLPASGGLLLAGLACLGLKRRR